MKSQIQSSSASKHWLLFSVCVIVLGFAGCKGVTENPTGPTLNETPVAQPSPKPNIPTTPTPGKGELPTPLPNSSSCDNYSDRPTDKNLRMLALDGSALRVIMDCAGDVDWFTLFAGPPTKLKIALTDMSDESDFDLVVYDSAVREIQRSSRSGNSDEELSLTVDGLLYVQVYAFSRRGEALLTVTALNNSTWALTPTPTPTPIGGITPTPTPEINQLTYEQLLHSKFWQFPRGTNSALLERSVETIKTITISCRQSNDKNVILKGELTIGNYAHVERDLLKSVDYIDGWALVVFNGSPQIIDILGLTTTLNISSDNLNMVVNTPPEVRRIDSDDFAVNSEVHDQYYVAHSYGDLSQSSSRDVRISSGVVGKANDVLFEQNVIVTWEKFRHEESGYTSVCFDQEKGKAIADFELENFLSFQE